MYVIQNEYLAPFMVTFRIYTEYSTTAVAVEGGNIPMSILRTRQQSASQEYLCQLYVRLYPTSRIILGSPYFLQSSTQMLASYA